MDELVLADRETDVMSVLWDVGSGTVAEVRERLTVHLAYTTVLTVLRTLEGKGVVAHVVAGQTYRYVPLVPRKTARRSALTRLLDKLFAGAPEQLLAHLVEDHSLGAKDLARLREQIDALEKRIERDGQLTEQPSRRSATQSKRGTTARRSE